MNFKAAIECCGNSVEHGQGVTFVFGVFEPADDRRRGADEFGELPLTEPGLGSQSGDFARYVILRSSPLQGGHPLRLALVIAAVKNLHRIGCRFSLRSRHDQPSLIRGTIRLRTAAGRDFRSRSASRSMRTSYTTGVL